MDACRSVLPVPPDRAFQIAGDSFFLLLAAFAILEQDFASSRIESLHSFHRWKLSGCRVIGGDGGDGCIASVTSHHPCFLPIPLCYSLLFCSHAVNRSL